VVEKRAVLVYRELVSERLSGQDGILAESEAPIHFYGRFQAMPVHRGHLWKPVLEQHADSVAFVHLDGGAGNAAAIAPRVGAAAGDELGRMGSAIGEIP